MRVILNQDIPRLGKKFDVREVSDGYARNMLFPKKLAIPADQESIKKINSTLALKKKDEENFLNHLKRIAQNLESSPLVFKLKSDNKNHPFGSVSKDQILKSLEENQYLNKIDIKLNRPIKTFGEHKIEINLKKGVIVTLKIKVEKE